MTCAYLCMLVVCKIWEQDVKICLESQKFTCSSKWYHRVCTGNKLKNLKNYAKCQGNIVSEVVLHARITHTSTTLLLLWLYVQYYLKEFNTLTCVTWHCTKIKHYFHHSYVSNYYLPISLNQSMWRCSAVIIICVHNFYK